jgi:PAS domain S-box-containing protein
MQLEPSAVPADPATTFIEGLDSDLVFALLRGLWAAPIGVALFDPDLRFVHVNERLARSNGVTPREHLGRRMSELFPDHSAEVAWMEAQLRSVFESGRACPALPVTIHRDGERTEWLARYLPILSRGAVRAVCAVVEDVTSVREREAAIAAARDRAEQTASRLALLQRVTAELARAVDAPTAADVIVSGLRDVLGAAVVTVRALGPDGQLRLLGGRGYPAHFMDSFGAVSISEHLPSCVAFRTREPVYLAKMGEIEARFPALAGIARENGHGAWAAVPLVLGDRALGVLGLVFSAEQRFDADERALVATVAEQCAQALERAFLSEAERASAFAIAAAADRLARLQAVTAALSAARIPEEVGATIAAHATAALGASAAATYVLSADAGTLALVHAENVPARSRFVAISIDAPLPAAEAARSRSPVWLSTLEALRARAPILGDADPRSASAIAAVPLVSAGRTVGALVLGWGAPQPFDAAQRELVVTVAEQCAQALDRAVLFRSERAQREAAVRANERVTRLQGVTAAFSQARTAEEVAAVMARHGRDDLAATSAVVLALERDGESLLIAAAEGHAASRSSELRRVPLDTPSPAAVVARTGEPLWLESAASIHGRYPRLSELIPDTSRLRALAALPLRAGANVLGALAFGFDEERSFGPEDRALLGAVAEQGGQALERARLLDAEQRARALLDALVDNAPVGIAFVDRDLRFQRVNRALAETKGIPIEAHLGKTPGEIVPGVPMDDLEEAWRRILETGTPVLDRETAGEAPASPGRRVWVESWYPVRVGDEVFGIGALVREVTAEREAEEFQRHVVGVVGHDIRTPLSTITTAAVLLARAAPLTPAQSRLVARVLRGAARIEEIARALLDYAQVRRGGVPIRRRPCDVAGICGAVAEEVGISWPDREIRCGGEGDGWCEWDPDRVAQVLGNLLSNAIQHGAPGAPVIVRWRGRPDEVVVEIVNQGPPIPPEIVPRLFRPFERGAGETRPGGLGLGLFIANAIVAAHGGRIDVRSTRADGTTFSVRLPRR